MLLALYLALQLAQQPRQFAQPIAANADEFSERVEKFHAPWIKFVRVYFDCPSPEPTCDTNKPGTIDRAAFAEARKAAIKLFDLKERQ